MKTLLLALALGLTGIGIMTVPTIHQELKWLDSYVGWTISAASFAPASASSPSSASTTLSIKNQGIIKISSDGKLIFRQ